MTPTQQTQLKEFIGKVVLENATLPYTLKFGQQNFTTIQDLLQMNAESLRRIGTQVEKAVKESTESRFSTETPKLGGISASEWADALLLIICYVEDRRMRKEDEAELAKLRIEQQQALTPKERRKQIDARMSVLEANLNH